MVNTKSSTFETVVRVVSLMVVAFALSTPAMAQNVTALCTLVYCA